MLTDGQTLYLILVIFYILQCIKLHPSNQIVITKNIFKGWSLNRPLIYLGGLKKVMQFEPFRPNCLSIYLGGNRRGRIVSAQRVASLLKLYKIFTSPLRFNSLCCFLLLYLLFPISFYIPNFPILITYALAGLGLVYMLFCGVTFYILHKRLHPEKVADRWKDTIISVSLPWNAIRACSSLLKENFFQNLHPLSFYAYTHVYENDNSLSQFYRKAIYLEGSQNPLLSEVEKVMILSGITKCSLTLTPKREDEAQHFFCPCCLVTYTKKITHCTDCRTVKLKEF